MKRLFRNANIGVAVGAILMGAGIFVFHGNEDLQSAATVVSFVVAMAVYFVLSERDERAGRMGPPHS